MCEHDRLAFWTKLLHLDGFQVVHEGNNHPDFLCLTVAPALPLGLCLQCRRATDHIHRTLDSAPVKDLSWGAQAVTLIVRTYQFQCPHCAAYFTPPAAARAPAAHATERFLDHAAKLIRFSDVQNAAAFLGVPEKTLDRWYYDYIQRQTQVPQPGRQPIRSLGSDELSLKKNIASSSPC